MNELDPNRVEKPWYKSKRAWWNILTLAFTTASALGGAGVIPAEAMAIINPVGNVVLNQISDGARLTLRK